MKKRSIRSLKTELWKLISKYIRQRDNFRCKTCGQDGNHCGHYRHNTERNALLGGNALWYDERNLNCQCAGCNTYRGGNLPAYAIYLERLYGQGILQDLDTLYRTYKLWTLEEIEEKIAFYKRLIHS